MHESSSCRCRRRADGIATCGLSCLHTQRIHSCTRCTPAQHAVHAPGTSAQRAMHAPGTRAQRAVHAPGTSARRAVHASGASVRRIMRAPHHARARYQCARGALSARVHLKRNPANNPERDAAQSIAPTSHTSAQRAVHAPNTSARRAVHASGVSERRTTRAPHRARARYRERRFVNIPLRCRASFTPRCRGATSRHHQTCPPLTDIVLVS